MARRIDGADQSLVELKAVDAAYPLHGSLQGVAGPIVMADAAPAEVWVDQLLLERLALAVGQKIAIGEAQFDILGTISAEPDRLSDGTIFGPRVMMTRAGLERAGLIRPGSLYTGRMAIRLDDASDAGVSRFMEDMKQAFPDNGWRIQSRDNAAPALARNIERFSQFLTLVGLTALIVGGVGVGNSARAFLDTKRGVIATLKSVGAPSRFIFQVYVIQIMMLAGLGIIAGLALGAAMPMIAREALRGLLPVAEGGVLHPSALALATAYGLLTAFVFTVWPLSQAQETPAATLFRSAGFSNRQWPKPLYLLMVAAGLAALAGLALAFSQRTHHRPHLPRRDGFCVRGAAAGRHGHRMGGTPCAEAPLHRNPHGARQYSPARIADRVGRAFAGPRPRADRCADADRRQPAQTGDVEPAEAGAFILLPRHPEHRV